MTSVAILAFAAQQCLAAPLATSELEDSSSYEALTLEECNQELTQLIHGNPQIGLSIAMLEDHRELSTCWKGDVEMDGESGTSWWMAWSSNYTDKLWYENYFQPNESDQAEFECFSATEVVPFDFQCNMGV